MESTLNDPAFFASHAAEASALVEKLAATKTEVARHFGVTRATLNAAFERAGIQDPLLAGAKPEQA